MMCCAHHTYAHDPFESTLTGDLCGDAFVAELATNYQNLEKIIAHPPELDPAEPLELPPQDALAILDVKASGDQVQASSFTVEPDPPEDVLFKMRYPVPDSASSTIKANLLPTLHYDHTLVTRITRCGEPTAYGFRVLFQGQESLTFEADEAQQSLWSVASSFFYQGFLHLALGIDHLIFLLSILLVSLHWRRALLMISAFTLAHSITLATSVSGWIANPAVVEPLIALSIMIMGLEAIVLNTSKPGSKPTTNAPDSSAKGRIWRLLQSPVFQFSVVFVFGLIHGLGFARAFAELQGDNSTQWLVALASFNLAIEFAQVVALALCYPILQLLRKTSVFPLLRTLIGIGILLSGMGFLMGALQL